MLSAEAARQPYLTKIWLPTDVPINWPMKIWRRGGRGNRKNKRSTLIENFYSTAHRDDQDCVDPRTGREWNSGQADTYKLRHAQRNNGAKLYPNMTVVSDTWIIWQNTSMPIVTIMTAATLMPPAAVCMAWKQRIMTMANSVAYHGMRLSMLRPTNGPVATQAIPSKPKRPITNLNYIVREILP